MKKLVLMLMLAVLVTAVQAEIIVDFTPGGAFVNARAADNSTLTGDYWDFSDTTPIIGAGAGQNEVIYGSLEATWTAEQDASPNVRHTDWNSTFQVQNNPANKTGSQGIMGVYVWPKEEFLVGSTERVAFGPGTSISYDFNWFTGTGDFRIVVKQDGSYYISEWTTTTEDDVTMDPTATNWAVLDTATTTWDDLTFAPLKLSNVEAVGLYYTVQVGSPYQCATELKDFQVDVASPLDPSPEDGAVVIIPGITGDVILEWTNWVDPNGPGETVTADIWFGTDPNKANSAVYNKVETLDVTAAIDQRSTTSAQTITDGVTYYWQVDFDNGEPNIIEGPVFEFLAVNNAQPVVSVKNVIAWLDEGTGQAVITLDATVVDDTPGYTLEWTFDPAGVAIDDAAIEDPTLTIDTTGVWTATLTIDDGYWIESAQAEITVAENHCEAARLAPGYGNDPVGDITGDCATDLQDLTVILETWLDDTRLTENVSF